MCKILFLENRSKTLFWQEIAKNLRANGHEVFWLVQNPLFGPRQWPEPENIHYLPFPKRGDLTPATAETLTHLTAERGAGVFGISTDHYEFYRAEIARHIGAIAPDVIIGEPTLFHERLVVAVARAANIPFFHPTMSRFPSARFNIFDGDSQRPIPNLIAQDVPDDDQLAGELAQIINGNIAPIYMAGPPKNFKIKKLMLSLKVLAAYFLGERFNTPNPFKKQWLEAKLAGHLKTWDRLARPLASGELAILYPLQMQPELNIDVWGAPFNDQTATIRAILAAAPEDVKVAVKANPKSKYEVNDGLLDLAKSDPRVVLLPLTQKMDQAQSATIGTLTISGTVGLEAGLGKGQCISLAHPVLADVLPQFTAPTIESAVAKILCDPKAGKGDANTGITLLRALYQRSFAGLVNEPLFMPACISHENLKLVVAAIERAIDLPNQK